MRKWRVLSKRVFAVSPNWSDISRNTFVLMKQNRMQRRTDQRDHLTLQVDLLAEKEVTKLLQLLRLVCQKLEIQEVEANMDLAEMSNITSVNIISKRIADEMPPAE